MSEKSRVPIRIRIYDITLPEFLKSKEQLEVEADEQKNNRDCCENCQNLKWECDCGAYET